MVKRLIYTLLLVLPLFSQAQDQSVRHFLDICRFSDPNSGDPILQIYVAVAGNSITFRREDDSMFQACVNIALSLRRVRDIDTVEVDSDIYNLTLSKDQRPKDTTLASRNRANLLNVQQLRLEPGHYLLQAIATDSQAPYLSRSIAVQEFEVEKLDAGAFAFSDIKWVAGTFPGRRGFKRDDMIPLVSNSTYVNEDSMVFYQEIYNTDQVLQENYLIRSVIYQGENRLWNYETKGQARAPGKVNAYRENIYIGNLSSNIYYLQVELINSKNRPVRSYRQKFYVYNSRKEPEFEMSPLAGNRETDIFNAYTETELDYYLKTLGPRATEQERNFTRALNTYEQKKNFLYSFFEKRRENASQEVLALWRGHLAALDYVNQHFQSAFRQGWQTDRGRVFLSYGIPNDVERFPSEKNLSPYEVWRYNRLGSQTNVAFIFFDPDLATNEYPLLHSTKYGELNNPFWKTQLTNSGRPGGGIDPEEEDNINLDSKLNIDD